MYELLRNKILTFEATPPEDGWELVREKLSAEELSTLAERLLVYKTDPPAGCWEEIAAGIPATAGKITTKEKKAAPVFTLSENRRKQLRWAAAAAILGLLLTGSYYFINAIDREESRIAAEPARVSNPEEQKMQPRPQQNARGKTPYTNNSYPAPANRSSQPVAGSYYNESRYNRKRSDNQVNQLLASNFSERPLHSAPVEEAPLPEMLPVSIYPGKIYGKNGELIQDMSVLNPKNSKYVNITAPNGQQTRVSAKLAFAMPYMGPSSSDPNLSGNYYWEQLIREWQDKILQSGFVPSSANFLDILEFSEMILE